MENGIYWQIYTQINKSEALLNNYVYTLQYWEKYGDS